MTLDRDTLQVAQVIEIRARHDKNRLLGTYDPVRRVLRLFHRGQTVVVWLADMEGVPEEIKWLVDIA